MTAGGDDAHPMLEASLETALQSLYEETRRTLLAELDDTDGTANPSE